MRKAPKLLLGVVFVVALLNLFYFLRSDVHSADSHSGRTTSTPSPLPPPQTTLPPTSASTSSTAPVTPPGSFRCPVPAPSVADLRLVRYSGEAKIPRHGRWSGNDFSSMSDEGLVTVIEKCKLRATYSYDNVQWHLMPPTLYLRENFMWIRCGEKVNIHVLPPTLPRNHFGLAQPENDHGAFNVVMLMEDSVSAGMFERLYKKSTTLFEKWNGDPESPMKVFSFPRYHAVGSNSLPNKSPIWGGFCWEKSCSVDYPAIDPDPTDLFLESGFSWNNLHPNYDVALQQDWVWRAYQKAGFISLYGEEESGDGRVGSSYSHHSILNFFKHVPEDLIDDVFPAEVFSQAFQKEKPVQIPCEERDSCVSCEDDSIGPTCCWDGGLTGCVSGRKCSAFKECAPPAVIAKVQQSMSCPKKIHASTTLLATIANRLNFNLLFDYLFKFFQGNATRKFASYMLNAAHEGSSAAYRCLDATFESFFEKAEERGILNNTIVILVADHGQKMGDWFQSPSGSRENVLPHLYFAIPRKLLATFPQLDEALTKNYHKLFSPHDLHVTLKHLAIYPAPLPQEDRRKYAVSILEPAPDRSCHEAAIPPLSCVCRLWEEVTDASAPGTYTVDALREKVSTFVISKLNEYVQNGEAMCKLHKLQSVANFLISAPEASENGDVVVTYRLDFKVKARRNMEFRAFITHKADDTLWMWNWDIFQTTKWGGTVHCHPEKQQPIPIEPQFCIC